MNRILTRLTLVAIEPASRPDGHLLDAFLVGRSEAAFASLVERHGSMVFAVCNRVLRHRQDAEDAFQAVFLILARRAADVRPRDAVGAWLYGVAHRVALKAHALRSRQRVRELPLGEQTPAARQPDHSADLAELIDRAVRSLPRAYRAAVVACDLEGLTRAEAAEQLGWKEGTLSGPLARARQLLAERLRRSGVTFPAGGIGVVIGSCEAVAVELKADTVRLALGSVGRTLASGASAPVVALTEGVVRGMFLAKLKSAAVAVLAVGVFGFGVWAAADVGDGPVQAPGDKPAVKGKADEKHALDLDAARGNLEHAWKYLDETLKWQQDWIKRGERSIDTPDELERELARFRSDVEMLARLLKTCQTALDAARAAGPAVKMPGDLVRMQGRWRVDTMWDGKQQRPIPAKEAPVFDIIGNKWYGPLRGDEKRGEREAFTIVLRPDMNPAEMDMIERAGGPLVRAIYRFTTEIEPRAGNLRISGSRTGPRPASFDQKDAVDMFELTRVTDEKASVGNRVVEGVNLTPAEKRRDLVYQELQLFLAEFQHRKPADSVQQFEDQLARDRSRLDQMRQLLDQAQKEFDKEKERVKPAAPAKPPGNLLDEARMRREVERLRAQVLLDSAKRREAAAQNEVRLATANVRLAELKAEEAKTQLADAQKVFDEFVPARESGVVVRDSNKKERGPTEAQANQIQALASALVASSTGELTGGKGKPFATATLWEKLEESGHVAVTFADARTFNGVADHPEVVVEAILIPIAPGKRPDYVLVRHGNTYRAFFGFRDEDEAALRTLLSKLK